MVVISARELRQVKPVNLQRSTDKVMKYRWSQGISSQFGISNVTTEYAVNKRQEELQDARQQLQKETKKDLTT